MSKRYRVAVVGFGHMHVNNVAALFAKHPQVEMAACADTTPLNPELRVAPYTRDWNRRNVIETCGVRKDWGQDWQEMVAKEKPDIVVCCTENARHPEVVEACADAGAAVCVEKPMAASLEHALRMVRASRAAGTTMLVNWPLTWSPAVRLAKELVGAGEIGSVLEIKWRAGHTGPLGPGAAHAGVDDTAAAMSGAERAATWWHQAAAGGGATLDFCSYGGMICRWFLGEPAVAAMGMKANLASQWGNADDNGAILLRFRNAMALLEGSWTTLDHGVACGPIVFGTTGTLVVDTRDGREIVRVERGHGASRIHEPAALPADRDQVPGELIHHLETGEPLHPTLDREFNLEVMAMLDAGLRSSVSGKLEPVDGLAWRIG
jgi:predicted dehydrogenase